MNLEQLRAALRELYPKLEEVRSKENPTEDDWKAAQQLLDQIEELTGKIETEERAQKIMAARNQGTTSPVTQDDDPNADNPDENKFRNFGEFLQAVARAGSPRGTSIGGARGGIIDRRLLAQFETPESRATGMSEGVPSDGGFLVHTDFAAEMIKRTYETGVLARRCRKIPISAMANGLKINGIDETSRANGSRWGGIQAYWKDEAAAKTPSKPKFRQIDMDLEKLIGLCYATDELLQDSTALGEVVMQGFPEEFGFKVDDAIFNGDGAGKPLGILNALSLVTVAKETGQSATSIVSKNVIKMYARCWARSMRNSLWLANQDIIPELFTLELPVGTGGVPAYMPAGGITGNPSNTLLGRPIEFVEHAASLGTVGDIVLADLSQYLLIDKGDIQTAQSIHVQFIYDETVFRFVYRVNGQPLWHSALTPFKGTANTISPIVALASRT